LAEAVALAHDLGHTPFGHAGERALDNVMAQYGGFDHNAQALKIVTQLEQRYAEFDGLNLSWETLEGLVKHNGPFRKTDHYIFEEYAAHFDLEYHTQAGPEAQAAALADDIAYVNHDLDDGLRAELFSMDDLRNLPILKDIITTIDNKYSKIDRGRHQHEVLRRFFGMMVEDVITQSDANIKQLNPKNVQDIRQAPNAVITFSPEMKTTIKTIKSFLMKRMYRHYKVNRMMSKAMRVVEELFEIFLKEPNLLPQDWQNSLIMPNVTNAPLARARVIGDYIAGMTDRYALNEHENITNPYSKI